MSYSYLFKYIIIGDTGTFCFMDVAVAVAVAVADMLHTSRDLYMMRSIRIFHTFEGRKRYGDGIYTRLE